MFDRKETAARAFGYFERSRRRERSRQAIGGHRADKPRAVRAGRQGPGPKLRILRSRFVIRAQLVDAPEAAAARHGRTARTGIRALLTHAIDDEAVTFYL
jgi:hypothetical protein